MDKETNTAVPFATIKVLHQPKGIIASEKGEFDLDIKFEDSVLVSSVGYQSKIFIGNKIDSIIYLARKIKSMNEVTVGNRKLMRTVVLGNGAEYLKKTIQCRYEEIGTIDGCWPWGQGTEKDEFAERIDLPDSIHFYKIKEIVIPIKVKCRYPMLLHIYSSDPNSEFPGEELLTKSFRFEKFLSHRKAVIDISDENIVLHGTNSFFVSFGWIREENMIPCFTNIIMKSSSKGNTYSRTLANSDFHWFNFGKIRIKENEEYTVTTFYVVRLDEMK